MFPIRVAFHRKKHIIPVRASTCLSNRSVRHSKGADDASKPYLKPKRFPAFTNAPVSATKRRKAASSLKEPTHV